jgi:hypothetical protein
MKSTEDIIDQFLHEKKLKIPQFLELHLDKSECLKIQKRYLMQDLVRNPINVFWAMPYFSIKKFLEIVEKIGFDKAASISQKIPKSFKTDYQKEIERLITDDFFDLDELESKLGESCSKTLTKDLKQEVRSEIAQYCAKQNEVSDLIASGVIVLLSHFTFGDKSLDLFGIGSKIANKWAYKKASSEFLLGEGLGNVFYKYSPPTPTDKQVYLFTSLVLIGFALLTTVIGVLSIPTQKRFGITSRQLHKLMNNIQDRLILKVAKASREPKHSL